MKRGPDFIIMILLLAAVLAACSGGGGGGVTGPPLTLTSIAISPALPAMAPGTTTQLKAIGTYSNNGTAIITSSVTWTSSNLGLATISNSQGSNGLVTSATTTGSTTITATSGSITGSTTLTVAHVASIGVTPHSPPSIAPGTGLLYAAIGTLSDSNSTQQDLTTFATWTSSDTSISDVSDTTGSKGFATAVSPGTSVTATAVITALYDGQSGTAFFQTSLLESIIVSPPAPSIPKGTSQQFAATGTLHDMTPQIMTSFATWSSFSTGVATISNAGLATAVSQGTTTIVASFSSVTSSPPAVLTVTAPVLSSITVTPVNPSIVLGQTEQFIALGTFTDSSILDISSLATWNSSDTSIATISNTSGSKGLASSTKTGSATITAIASGISGTTILTVSPAVLQSIEILPANEIISLSSPTLSVNQQFTAIGHFSDNSTQDLTTFVTWSSSITNVATISNIQGSIGLATLTFLTGTTTITAVFPGLAPSTTSLSVVSF